MDIEDAERHRQTLASVNHPHQVGVLQVVITQLVAGVAVFQQDDLVERASARGEVACGTRVPSDIAGEQPQMIAIAPEGDPRALE
jgi:hypothetical protein